MIVHWTEAALTDARAIETYIARHSARYAQGLIDRLFSRTESLADLPRLGAMVPEYDDENLRELFEDPCRIVYRILEQQIDVVAVVHAARRFPRGL